MAIKIGKTIWDTEESPSMALWRLLRSDVITDGGHHKQWYLEQIAKILNIPLPEHDRGIAP